MRRMRYALLSAILLSFFSQISFGYILGNRWARTAISGTGLQQGDPTVISWSFVPDGTPSGADVGPSDLIQTMDSIFGAGPGGSDFTQRPWFRFYEGAFERWGSVSGLSYEYEPNDDGATHSVTGNVGLVGVRGDVRLAGTFQNGPGGVLAFNFFPDNGDMTLDTGDVGIIGDATNDYRAFRNILQHEHGHGIGLSHIESNTDNFLMEPFLATTFDGIQLDDIRGANRGYGDKYERSNNNQGNDSAALATPLGLINDGQTATLGTNGSSTVVAPTDTDFVSIDGSSDTDFFSFSIDSPGMVDLTLTPQGATYFQGGQGGSQSSFDTSDDNNLVLALVDSNQSTVLTTNNSGGAGQADSINGFVLSQPGEYYVRVTGTQDSMQFYRLDVTVMEDMTAVTGDFDSDLDFDCNDVDALVVEIVAGTDNAAFDMDGDGSVDGVDLNEWLIAAGANNLASGNSYLYGDANLDGLVDGIDFIIWNDNRFTNTPAWCSGDFSADGVVDGIDFIRWNSNAFMSADTVAVPEPGTMALLAMTALIALSRRS